MFMWEMLPAMKVTIPIVIIAGNCLLNEKDIISPRITLKTADVYSAIR